MAIKTQQTNRDGFLESFENVTEWFEIKGIEYRLMGSIATSAYIDSPDHESVKFDRPALRPEESVPDIDVIVPRGDLPEVRKYRESLLAQPFPVALGLSFSSRFIDMRPRNDTSYLTSSERVFGVPSAAFEPVEKSFYDVAFKSLPAATLGYTYTMVGYSRHEDVPRQKALLKLASELDESVDYSNFQEFAEYRRENMGLVEYVGNRVLAGLKQYPKAGTVIKRGLLPLADALGYR
jgi:hypothetical protein